MKKKLIIAFTYDKLHTSTNIFQKIWNNSILKGFYCLKKKFYPNETGEVLVDNDMLVWCYLQGGVIEFIGCIMTYVVVMLKNHVKLSDLFNTASKYFIDDSPPLQLSNNAFIDSKTQLKFLAEAQSAYFLAIVITQWFNLFIQKHRYTYPWGRNLFLNTHAYIGLIIGALLAGLIVYTPGIQSFFRSDGVLPLPLLVPLSSGVLLFIYEVIRRNLRMKGYFGGIPKKNQNLVELIRTTTSIAGKQ